MYWYLYLKNLLKTEKGQDLGEYALLFGLIAIIVLAAVTIFGDNLNDVFQAWADEVAGWAS